MSTNCNIALKTTDGTYNVIYSHWDGYVSGVSKTLFENYNSSDKVKPLIQHGDISSLGVDLDTTTFYHRDMNEPRLRTMCKVYFELQKKMMNQLNTFMYLKMILGGIMLVVMKRNY